MTRKQNTFPESQINLLKELPDNVQFYLENLRTQHVYFIVTHRYGLHGETHKTLVEIGDMLGFTRERARQLQNIALRKFHAAIFEQLPRRSKLEPAFVEEAKLLYEITSQGSTLVSDADMMALLQDRYSYTPTNEEVANLQFLLECYGYEPIKIDDTPLIWKRKPSSTSSTQLKRFSEYSADILQKAMIPLSLEELIEAIQKRFKKQAIPPKNLIRFVLEANRSIEYLGQDRYQMHFIKLGSGYRYAYRCMWEKNPEGKPMDPIHSNDITDEVNQRLRAGGKRAITRGTIVNSMSRHSDKFIPIGKSGYWGLTAWGVEGDYIENIMLRCFEQLGRPARAREITDCVLEIRPVLADMTVSTYLATKPHLFTRLATGVYQPATWDIPEDFDPQAF